MTEYDIPWKEVFDKFLKEFLQFCLPEVHDAIDWDHEVENKEQELPKLFPDSLAKGRVADKLFRAKIRGSDQPQWFMIHAEVQVSRDSNFSQRIFTCFYRILDKFQEPVVCIGLIADSSLTWRPGNWEQGYLGCHVSFNYPIVKLRDYQNKIDQLAESSNPFATVILSHLQAQDSSRQPKDRFRYKIELVKSLYQKQWDAEAVRNLFRFIDWIIDLPDELELQFKDQVREIELENQMPYVTSIERLAKLEGKLEGKQEGQIQLLQELLGLSVMTEDDLQRLSTEEQQELLNDLRKQIQSEKK